MANDLFRDLVSIARNYLHPFQAETYIHKWCEKCNTNEDDVKPTHLPSIVLAISTDNTIYDKLKFHQYLEMLKRFMAFSNQYEDGNLEQTKEFVREQKDLKKKESIL